MKTTREMILEELREMIGKELDVLNFLTIMREHDFGYGYSRTLQITVGTIVPSVVVSYPAMDDKVVVDYEERGGKKIVTDVNFFANY